MKLAWKRRVSNRKAFLLRVLARVGPIPLWEVRWMGRGLRTRLDWILDGGLAHVEVGSTGHVTREGIRYSFAYKLEELVRKAVEAEYDDLLDSRQRGS